LQHFQLSQPIFISDLTFRIIFFMTLLIILFCVFASVALMVVLGQRFGKPMEAEQQQKYSKILWVVVFIAIVAAIIRQMMA
jgi:Na+-driven multidrug efflux pump